MAGHKMKRLKIVAPDGSTLAYVRVGVHAVSMKLQEADPWSNSLSPSLHDAVLMGETHGPGQYLLGLAGVANWPIGARYEPA